MFRLRKLSYLHETSDNEKAIKGVSIDSLDLSSEGVTALIGPSGSGKTTLLSLLSGFIRPKLEAGGVFEFDGTPLPKSGHSPGDVAFVFQSPMLLGSATAISNMLQGSSAANRPVPTPELTKTLNQIGLVTPQKSLIAQRSDALSGGEKQRVAVMRALLSDSKVILCDEPTSSLDVNNATAVMNAFKFWSETKKRPVIWVTHNILQAAKFADHYVFLDAGQIVEPSQDIKQTLSGDDVSAKESAITEFLSSLSATIDADPISAEPKTEVYAQDVIQASQSQYNGWIASALSYSGLSASWIDRISPYALLPRSLADTTRSIDPHEPSQPGLLARLFSPFSWFLGRAASYTQYGLALVLCVLFIQIFVVQLIKGAAGEYVETRLQDPSVARIVFEYDSLSKNQGSTADVPDELYADSSIPFLETSIQDQMTQFSAIDRSRVRIFGRRSLSSSLFSFPELGEACSGWFRLEATALSLRDPIFNQTVASEDLQVWQAANIVDTIHEIGTAYPENPETALVAIMDERTLKSLLKGCDVDLTKPVPMKWALDESWRNDLAMDVSVVLVAKKMPPLFPAFPRIILLEEAYQDAIAQNALASKKPDPFGIATAYFPIEAFKEARETIEQNNYVIRDDSEAAVSTLKQVANIMETVPPWLLGINLAAMFMICVIVIGNVLELNKRVFTLFRAHGFKLLNVMSTMLRHIAPATVIGFGGFLVIRAVFWPYILSKAPVSNDVLQGSLNLSILFTGLCGFGSILAAAIFVTVFWWRRTRKYMTKYLQE